MSNKIKFIFKILHDKMYMPAAAPLAMIVY